LELQDQLFASLQMIWELLVSSKESFQHVLDWFADAYVTKQERKLTPETLSYYVSPETQGNVSCR